MNVASALGRYLSALIFLLTPVVSLALEYPHQFVDEFTRVLHAKPLSADTYVTEFTHSRLLSSKGSRFNPHTEIFELERHLKKLKQNGQLAEYYCEYPATYLVMKNHISALPAANFQDCKNLQPFLNDVSGLSIVFAAGYMGNPASYFGHMFIKIERSDTKLKNETFNIGADVPENENPILYMFKGLFGAYQTDYKSTTYYKQTHAYSQLEGRDLYEYKLKLSPQQVTFLTLHLYELQQASFDYYFTHRNCAYEIYRYLYTLKVLPEIGVKPFFYPVHLIDYLEQNQLIKQQEYTPSNKTKFSQLFFELSAVQRAKLETLIGALQGHTSADDVAQKISKEEAELLLYYAYAHLDEERDKSLITKIKRLRLFFPAGKSFDENKFKIKNLTSRAPIMLSAGLRNQGDTNGLSLTFRPAHYSQSDKPADVADGSKLIFLQLSILLAEQAYIDELTLVDVHKSEIGKTGLYANDEFEWGVTVAYHNKFTQAGKQSDLFTASGYIGDAYPISSHTWLQYGLNTGIRNSIENKGNLFLRPEITLTAKPSDDVKLLVKIGHEFVSVAGSDEGTILELEVVKQTKQTSAIFASFNKDLYGHNVNIGYRHYF